MDYVTGTPCKGAIAGSRPSDSILADMRRFVTGNTEAPASHLGVTEASLSNHWTDGLADPSWSDVS
jgi:hypothetical protein